MGKRWHYGHVLGAHVRKAMSKKKKKNKLAILTDVKSLIEGLWIKLFASQVSLRSPCPLEIRPGGL